MAAGVELATAWVRLVPSFDGLGAALNKGINGSDVNSNLKRGGKNMGAVLTGAIAGATALALSKATSLVTSSIGNAVKRVDTINNFPKMMKNLGYSAEDASKSIRKMGDRLAGLPTALDTMTGMVTQLAPLTGGLDKATEVALALNNAMLAGGKSTDMQANAMEQYTQMLAIGKVDMAAWRSMVGAMPGQMDQLSVALLGAGNKSMDLYEAMKDGTISFDQFNDALLDLNANGIEGFASFEKQARDSTDGIQTGWANMQTGITRGVAKIVERSAPAIMGAMDGVSTGFKWAFDSAAALIDLFMTGDFNAGLREAFGWEEDSPFVDFLLNVRDLGIDTFKELKGGITAFVEAFKAGGDDVTSSGFPGAMERVGLVLRAVYDVMTENVIPALVDFGKFLWENKEVVAIVAGVIGTVLIPMLVVAGVKALVSAGQQVTAWVMTRVESVKSAAAQVINGYKVIGAWVKMALAAIKSGAETAAIWLMLKWDAIKAAGVYALQSGRVAAAWARQSLAAAASWVKQKAVFVAQKVALLAQAGATKVAAGAQRVFNAVMKANPIGLIITAVLALVGALVWFFTQTELGKAIWEGFMTWLVEAWQNIVNVATTVWQGLTDFFTGMWDGIKGFFSGALDFIVDLFLNWTVYGLIIKNWDAIAKFFSDVWTNIKNTVSAGVNWVKNIISTVTGAIKSAWTAVWTGISSFFKAIWDGIVWFVTTYINGIKLVIETGINIVRNVWNTVWNAVSNIIKNVWGSIKNTIQTMMDFVRTKPKEAFEKARDAIGSAWNGIKELAAKPVRFVVDVVFGGLVDTVNKFLPKSMHLARPKLPAGFRKGGMTPDVGYDNVAGVVHGSEFVTRAESTARMQRHHPGLLEHINRHGTLPGYRKGGLVHPLPGSVITTQWMGYPGHTGMDFAKPQGTPIQAAAAGVVSKQFYHVNYGNMVDLNHGGGFSTRYAHMLSNVAVKLGQVVKAGQVVGYEGSTGNSTGPHLHFETLQNGSPMNPAPFLSGAQSVTPAFGIVEGLLDGAVSKFKGAFPGGGFFADAAAGLMRSGVQGFTDWIGEKLSFGVGGGSVIPKLYDDGGVLPPGLTLTNNQSRKPEYVMTNDQWRNISDIAESSGRGISGPFQLHLSNGEVLIGMMRQEAGKVVAGAITPVSDGVLDSVHGRRR